MGDTVKRTALAVVEADTVIVSMRRASAALVEAQTIQQTKKVLDVAAAAEIYARRQHLGEEAQGLAVSIKVEALRKLGEMLHTTPKSVGVKLNGRDIFGGTKSEPPKTDAATLSDLGLTKKESAVAQKLAKLSDEDFEQVRDGHVTVAKALAAVQGAKAKPVTPPPKAAQETKPPPDEGPSAEELREASAAEQADAEVVRLLLESDDKLAALAARCKQQAAQIAILESRVRGLTNEAAQAVRLAKSWRQKFEKMEKAAA